MIARERFVNAINCLSVDRPPVWLMRQAGRCLPEYRALKEKHSFVEMVQTPELATEVTLQPIRRFGFDAAILFSDILVVPEALGQAYRFAEGGGIEMDFLINDATDVARLNPSAIEEKLQYVAKALRLLNGALGGKTALIGFSGAPWTLANFMLEGGSSREFTRAKQLFYNDPSLFNALMEKLTDAVSRYLLMQVEAGVDAIQIFDTLAGNLAPNSFEAASGCWIRQIVARLHGKVPVIVFAKGVHANWRSLIEIGSHALSVDWTISMADLVRSLPHDLALQGNLDPTVLQTNPAVVEREVSRLLREVGSRTGYIFNLGHGVPPNASLENIEMLVGTVQQFSARKEAGAAR